MQGRQEGIAFLRVAKSLHPLESVGYLALNIPCGRQRTAFCPLRLLGRQHQAVCESMMPSRPTIPAWQSRCQSARLTDASEGGPEVPYEIHSLDARRHAVHPYYGVAWRTIQGQEERPGPDRQPRCRQGSQLLFSGAGDRPRKADWPRKSSVRPRLSMRPFQPSTSTGSLKILPGIPISRFRLPPS